jgi:chemotaxis methyl-accepting protein methylase
MKDRDVCIYLEKEARKHLLKTLTPTVDAS